MRSKILFFGAAALLIGLVVLLYQRYPYALQSGESRAHAAYMLLFAVVMLSAVIAHYSGRGNAWLRDVAIWVGIAAVIIIGYSYRDIFLQNRLMRELLPHRVQVTQSGELVLQANRYGHFFAETKVNGVSVRFMVDTGASGVTLTKGDAERAGIAVEELQYSRVHSTANGLVRNAPVTLDMIEMGPVLAHNVEATINGGELDVSLLGMSFLRKFRSMRVEGSQLYLTP